MLSALVVAAALQAATGFAPPLDRAIDYVATDVREGGGRTLRFEMRRRVTFRRAADGLTAEVTTLGVDATPGPAGEMFAAMMRATIGRRVVFRLAPDGRIIDVDDLDGHWRAHVDAIAALARSGDARSGRASAIAAIAAGRRAAPRVQQIAILGDILTPVIATAVPPPSAPHPITLPGRAHDGTATTLTGTEAVSRAGDGLLDLVRQSSGNVAGVATQVSLRQRIDPATGLVHDRVERLASGTDPVAAVVTRTVRITQPVS